MAAHDNHLPVISAHRRDTTSDTARTHAARDSAAVIVWRVAADLGATVKAGPSGNPLPSRLARHLITLYSAVDGTVIDYDADTNLRHAAKETSRTYMTVTGESGLDSAPLEHSTAALIMMRWPRPSTTTPAQEALHLLATCHQYLAPDGSTIVVVTATNETAGTAYQDHEQVLLPAAKAVGLRYLHDIIAISTEDDRDAFAYATSSACVDVDSTYDTTRQSSTTTLMIFGQPGTKP